MRIVVIAGTGVITSRVLATLRAHDHEVVPAVPQRCFDAATGAGLAPLLRGAAVVVDLSDPPTADREAAVQRFAAATRILLDHEAEADVGHHVGLTPAGAAYLPEGGWFRAGLAQEQLIRHSGVPYSIVRAAPFFEFLGTVADEATRGSVVHVPPVLVQAVAAEDVARLVAAVAGAPPLEGVIEIGGPESYYLDALLERVLGTRNDPRGVTVDPHALYLGARLDLRSLVAGDGAELGAIRFDDWLRTNAGARPGADGAVPTDVRPDSAYTFRVSEVPAGSVLLLDDVAVFSVAGGLCATQAMCTHKAGPLSEGSADDSTVTCPLHGARFDIWTGAVLRGPANSPLRTYPVVVEGGMGRVIIGPDSPFRPPGERDAKRRKPTQPVVGHLGRPVDGGVRR